MSPGVELMTRDVTSCGGIRSSPIDTYPIPLHPCVRTAAICSVGDTTKMKSYGLVALAPLATTHPSTLQVEQVTQFYQVGEQRPSPPRTVRLNSLILIPKTCPSGLTSSLKCYSSLVNAMLTSGSSARLSRTRAKKHFYSGK